MRPSCRITTGGQGGERKKVFGGQVIEILREVDGSKPVVIAAQEHDISWPTIPVEGQVRRDDLERTQTTQGCGGQNARLKRIVAKPGNRGCCCGVGLEQKTLLEPVRVAK